MNVVPALDQDCKHDCFASALRSASAAIAPRVRLPIVTWAERYFRLTRGPLVGAGSHAVPWTEALDPLSTAPLLAMVDSRWSLVVEMGSPQASGKTSRVLIRLLYGLEQERSDFLYFTPSKDLSRDQWQAKLKPAMEADATLRRLIPEEREEQGVHFSRRFDANGAVCMGYFRGADSRGALAGVSAPIVVADDVHAMSRFPEGDHPADVARERSDALPATKRTHILIGQAGMENDYLARKLFDSTFYVPAVACIKCGVYQLIEWDRIKFQAEDPSSARQKTSLCCASCKTLIGQQSLKQMLKSALWCSTPPGENWVTNPHEGGTIIDLKNTAVYPDTYRSTTVCGFWRSALYWPYVPWGDQAVKYLESKGSPEAFLNFQRRVRCVPQKPPAEMLETQSPAQIVAHAGDTCRWGIVHDIADILLLTADCQNGYVYFVVRAWRRDTGCSWLVESGTSKTEHRASGLPGGLELLGSKDAAGWKRADGSIVRPRRCAVDSGYEPDLVWRHVVRYGTNRWFPTKGQSSANSIWPSAPSRVRQRLYWPIGVNEAKSVLWQTLQIPAGKPGYHALPGDMPTQSLDAYSRHMVSEVWDDTRRLWVRVKQKTPGVRGGRNDYWDCEVLQVALAISLGVKLPAFDGPVISGVAKTAAQKTYRGPGPLGPRKAIRRNYR